jgi:hypothetical protein
MAARFNQLLQLFLEFDAPPQNAEQLLHRLRVYGLKGITKIRLTSNRAVMVSFSGTELRVNKGYLDAPEDVLRAIVQFVQGRTRADRHEAQRTILTHPVAAALLVASSVVLVLVSLVIGPARASAAQLD